MPSINRPQPIENKASPIKFWRTIQKIEHESKSLINNLKYEDTEEAIPENQLAEEINNYFVDIGEKLAAKLIPPDNDASRNLNINDQHFDLEDTNQDEIKKK